MTEKEFNKLRAQYDALKRELSFNDYIERKLSQKISVYVDNAEIKNGTRLYEEIKKAVIDFGWKITNNDIQMLLGNKKERTITYNQNRFVAQLCPDGELITEFYHGQCDNSHSNLAERLRCLNTSKYVNNDIPMLGAFYSLLCGNGYGPELVIYGESCDYPHSRLTAEQIEQYKDALETYCNQNNYKLTFNI